MKERYCEICGGLVGVMSAKAWEQMDYICDICRDNDPKYMTECEFSYSLSCCNESIYRD